MWLHAWPPITKSKRTQTVALLRGGGVVSINKKENCSPSRQSQCGRWRLAATAAVLLHFLCNVSTAAPLRSSASGHVRESVSLAPRNVRVFIRSSAPASCDCAEHAGRRSGFVFFYCGLWARNMCKHRNLIFGGFKLHHALEYLGWGHMPFCCRLLF